VNTRRGFLSCLLAIPFIGVAVAKIKPIEPVIPAAPAPPSRDDKLSAEWQQFGVDWISRKSTGIPDEVLYNHAIAALEEKARELAHFGRLEFAAMPMPECVEMCKIVQTNTLKIVRHIEVYDMFRDEFLNRLDCRVKVHGSVSDSAYNNPKVRAGSYAMVVDL